MGGIMGKIEQGRFYHIQFMDTGKKDYFESNKPLVDGRVYRLQNGRTFRVIKKAHFKYTFEDIDTLRVLTEDYDIGTVQNRLSVRMAKAFNGKVPAVRFSDEEREILGYIYYENQCLTEEEKRVLRKVLNTK